MALQKRKVSKKKTAKKKTTKKKSSRKRKVSSAIPADNYDFPLFFSIWMLHLGLTIPQVHLDMIKFIEEDEWINRTKVLLLWRSIGKSMLVNLWIAYKLSKDPTLRFLVLASSKDKADDNVSTVLEIIYNHPLCSHLIRKDLETRKNRFFVNGYTDRTNPSVRAKSISSRITGIRCDYLIFDDAEEAVNSGTPYKRRILRKQISEAKRTRVETGYTLFIGTYHDTESIYDEEISRNSAVLKVPLLTKTKGEWPYMTGVSNWEERFGRDEIFQIQTDCVSKSEFFSQYLLIPTSIKQARFDQSKLNIYTDEAELIESDSSAVMKIGDKIFQSVSSYWDPSGGKAGRDHSVLSIVFTDTRGDTYIHRVVNVSDPDHNVMCRKVKQVALEFNLPVITVEKNGVGEFVGRMLAEELRGTGIGVEEHYVTGNKQDRIIMAIETRLYSGKLYVHKSVMDTGFASQLRDFDATLTNQEDDYIDSVASAINREPILINTLAMDGGSQITNWAGNKSIEIAMPTIEF